MSDEKNRGGEEEESKPKNKQRVESESDMERVQSELDMVEQLKSQKDQSQKGTKTQKSREDKSRKGTMELRGLGRFETNRQLGKQEPNPGETKQTNHVAKEQTNKTGL